MSYVQSNDIIMQPSFEMSAENQVQILYAADSGKTIIIPPNVATGGTQEIMLPEKKTNLFFRFFIKGPITKIFVLSAYNSELINHVLYNKNNADDEITINVNTAQNAIGIDGNATTGDWLEATCDGTNWYVTGVSQVEGGFF